MMDVKTEARRPSPVDLGFSVRKMEKQSTTQDGFVKYRAYVIIGLALASWAVLAMASFMIQQLFW